MHRMFRAAASAAAIFCVFLSQAAFSATITVDDGTDILEQKGGTCDLRDAVESANTDSAVDGCTAGSGADIIQFTEGLAGTTIDLAVIGDITAGQSALRISSDITILGNAFDGITLSIAENIAKGAVLRIEMRHFYVGDRLLDCDEPKGLCKGNGDPTDPALTLENVTVINGNTRGGDGGVAGNTGGNGGGAAGMGGAIFNDQSTVSINNSTLVNNQAVGGDGGFDNVDTKGSGVGGGGGGGLAGDGQDAQDSGSKGHLNDPGAGGPPNGGSPPGGDGGFGGGGAGGSGFEDKGCKGIGGSGGNGGFGGGGGGGGGVEDCFKGDSGSGGNGGFGGGGGAAGSFENDKGGSSGSGGFGGGGAVDESAGGGAGMGGAVFSYFGTVNVTNSTISGNSVVGGDPSCTFTPIKGGCPAFKGSFSARGLGGGIFMHDGTLDMNNTTMSNNAARNGLLGVDIKGGSPGDGGAVYIFDTAFNKSGAVVTINNSILANSDADDDFDTNADAGDCKGTDCKGDIGSGNNNIIEDNEGFVGGNNATEPFLLPLTDNGGPTETQMPEGVPDNGAKGEQSPAIGGGNNATCEDEDQRHFIPRPFGSDCDIGSVEVGAAGDDGDDVDAEVEDGAPNDGDGNDDGVLDSIQSDVASLPAGAGGGYVTVEIIEDCGQLRNVMTLDAASLPPNVGPEGAAKVYPHGLVEFELPCESAIVDVIFHNAGDISGAGYDKYGPVVPGDVGTTAWYSFSGPGFATSTGPNVWTLDLEDGRLGDDTDGTDDIIFDQGGPSFPGGPIPAVDWRGLLLLALLILSAAALAKRGRQDG